MIKAAQLRLHKEKVLAIEGDDEDAGMQATGLGQGEFGDDGYIPIGHVRRTRGSSNLGGSSFFRVGQAVAEK
jgi:hypothetical protein